MKVSPEWLEAERTMRPLLEAETTRALQREAEKLDAEIMGRVRHYFWPSEFPLALCGAMSRCAVLAEARRVGVGNPICVECVEAAAKLLSFSRASQG